MYKIPFIIFMLFSVFNTLAAPPAAPSLHVDSEGRKVELHWSEVEGSAGYRLFYAPYPYQGVDTIGSFEMGTDTYFTVELWEKAAFYVAVKAYDASNHTSGYSNIGFLKIHDRGEDYYSFWRSVVDDRTTDIFTADEFLYEQLPDVRTCFEGRLSEQAKLRQLHTLNRIRQLHNLADLDYDTGGDLEVQNASLIQYANGYLTHAPPENAHCYSQIGFDGSSSSNLHLGNDNGDPADDLIGLVDDAFNVSAVAAVGHRRHLLNPFLQFNSYGQVFGSSAVKVLDFPESSSPDTADIPDFVAFPFLNYPYLFFSDKTHHRKTPWNFTVIEDKSSSWANQHDYFSKAKVTVTQKSDARVMTVTDIHTDTDAFGIPNNLSWIVDNWQYDTWYTVTVDNLSNQSGKIDSISYDVFVDYKNFIDIHFPLEAGDLQKGPAILGTLSDQEDKDSFEVTLKGKVTFSGESQFSNMAFFIALFDADKQLLMAADEPFTLDLPLERYTVVIANCHEQACYSQSKDYSVQMN